MKKVKFTKEIIIYFLLSIPLISYNQELKVIHFNILTNNTSARIYPETDINGYNCAIIIIKHNFKNYIVETGRDYERLEEKIGETWVWVSPEEYRLVIRKQGYVPLEIDLKNKLVPLETYELVVTDGYGQIIAKSEKSEFFLDGKKIGYDSICINIKEGQYILKATKEKFYSEEKYINLKSGETKSFVFNLKPRTGKLRLNISPIGSVITINGKEINSNEKELTLVEDTYLISASNKLHKTYTENVSIQANRTINIVKDLEYDPTLRPNYQFINTMFCMGGEYLKYPSIGLSYGFLWKNRKGSFNGFEFAYFFPSKPDENDEKSPCLVIAYQWFAPRRSKIYHSVGINYLPGFRDNISDFWPYWEIGYVGKKITVPFVIMGMPNPGIGLGVGLNF